MSTRYIVKTLVSEDIYNNYATARAAAESLSAQGNEARMFKDNTEGVVFMLSFVNGAAIV